MSRREWILAGTVIGVGILLQIAVSHDETGSGLHDHDGNDHAAHAPAAESGNARAAAPVEAPESGPYRTVALEVTGMT